MCVSPWKVAEKIYSAVTERFLKAVTRSAPGALGGKWNVALCLESQMGLHASQHVSAPSPSTLPPTHPTLSSPPVLPEHRDSLCEIIFHPVFSRRSTLIDSSSSGEALLLFLAQWRPVSCFFAHPVGCGWKYSLISSKSHPIQSCHKKVHSDLFLFTYRITVEVNDNSDEKTVRTTGIVY